MERAKARARSSAKAIVSLYDGLDETCSDFMRRAKRPVVTVVALGGVEKRQRANGRVEGAYVAGA